MILKAFKSSETVIRRHLRRFFADNQEIDDICQEAIARALEIARTQPVSNPEGFLFGVARNVMRETLDKKSRSLIDFIDGFIVDEHEATGPSLEQELDEQRSMLRFANIVAKLPPQCQRVFVLRKIYGFSNQEVASRLGISVSTVEKHVAAGMKRCLDSLDRGRERAGLYLANPTARPESSTRKVRHRK